jgi:hypothetical protein
MYRSILTPIVFLHTDQVQGRCTENILFERLYIKVIPSEVYVLVSNLIYSYVEPTLTVSSQLHISHVLSRPFSIPHRKGYDFTGEARGFEIFKDEQEGCQHEGGRGDEPGERNISLRFTYLGP